MAVPLYLWLEDKSSGPFTEEQVAEMLAQNRITPQTYGWMAGCADWIPLPQLLQSLKEQPTSAAAPEQVSNSPELQEARKQIEALTLEKAALKQQLGAEVQARHELAARLQLLEAELGNTQGSLRGLEEALCSAGQSAEQEKQEMRVQLEARHQRSMQQAESLQALESDLQQSRQDLDTARKEIEEARKELDQARNLREKTDGVILQFRTQVHEAKEKALIAERCLEKRERELGEIARVKETDLQKLRAEVLEKQTAISRLHAEANRHQQEIGKLGDTDLKTLQMQVQQLQDEKKRLEEKVRRETSIQAAFMEQMENELKQARLQKMGANGATSAESPGSSPAR